MKVKELIDNAVKRYDNATDNQKTILKTVFGEEHFVPKEITERIKTVEDAFNALTEDELKELTGCPNYEQFAELEGELPEYAYNYMIACVVAKALNEGWTPDWDNSSEYKYYPWFNMSPSVGFSFGGFAIVDAYSTVGSLLCFKSRKLSDYAGKQFLDVYEKIMVTK